MVEPLDSPQPVFTLPPLDQIPDNLDDAPEPGTELKHIGPLQIPELVFGAATFSHFYNSEEEVASYNPLRTIRLALRYGIRTFDTSAYYGPSEIVLGTALKALESEYPRSSYKLMTKCGRYGHTLSDYSPATIRTSVKRSLARLNTTYLDTVYLHDVEFVSERVAPRASGNHVLALGEEKDAYGLAEGDEAKVRGDGDRMVLGAVAELRKLQEEGAIGTIGITGYPLPTLLRLALLVLHTPPYKPLDVILSYSQLNLQNSSFAVFAPHFRERAKVSQLLNASPLNMGLLRPSPPQWHPAPEALRQGVMESVKVTSSWAGGLPNIAIGYSIEQSRNDNMPVVLGYSSTSEVHESMRIWRELQDNVNSEKRKAKEDEVKKVLEKTGYLEWAWA